MYRGQEGGHEGSNIKQNKAEDQHRGKRSAEQNRQPGDTAGSRRRRGGRLTEPLTLSHHAWNAQRWSGSEVKELCKLL